MAQATFEELVKLASQSTTNFSDEKLPEGEFDTTVKVAKAGESPNGYPQISVLYQDENGAVSPWDNLTFGGSDESKAATAVNIALGKLKVLGVKLEGSVDYSSIAKEIVGRPAHISITPQKGGQFAGKLQVGPSISAHTGTSIGASNGTSATPKRPVGISF